MGLAKSPVVTERGAIRMVRKGITNPHLIPGYLCKKALHIPNKYFNYGTNIYEEDWDTLIILDACRSDLFTEFGPKHPVYQYFNSVDSKYSIASRTPDWIKRTVKGAPESELKKTHYISCTGFITEVEDEKFYDVEHVWRYAHDEEARVTRPEAVTDAAINAFRNSGADRYIVHYVQPHAPFLHCVGKYNSIGDGAGGTQNVWKGLKAGKYNQDEVWEDYGQNLLTILDHVETLINNVTGHVVVTSDHGNAMGEWGVYGHPGHHMIPAIREVPWAEAEGRGNHDYVVQGKEKIGTELGADDHNDRLEKHLRDLGYL